MQYFPVARCQLRTPHLPGQLPDPTKVNSAKKHVTHQALRKLIIFNALNQETSIEFCADETNFEASKCEARPSIYIQKIKQNQDFSIFS